ncbi:MAG: hypothetical protein KA175_12345 [Flavobacteriales bacterium]|nr:hypothetical protein [Flavobacteriales bacterium]MBP6698403.1 hypothetical protein [Flavobacteriales bacterium]
MRTLIPLITALTLGLTVQAQEDTTGTEQQHKLELGINSKKGVYAEVSGDKPDADGRKRDTLTFQLKHKVITILTEDKEGDTTASSIKERLKQARRDRRSTFTYWTGVELGLNNYMSPNGGFDLPQEAEFMALEDANSRFFALNVWEQKIDFGSHHVGLFTGLGLEFVNYRLSNNVQLAYNNDSVFGVQVISPEYRKNKLREIGLRVPLMLEFNTKRAPLPTEAQLRDGSWKGNDFSRKNNFHVAVGVVGSWYFDTMYKVKYRVEGETEKDRSKGDFNLLKYRLAARAQIGWGGLNLFAEYSLTPLFEEGTGPELIPVNAGIALVGFN